MDATGAGIGQSVLASMAVAAALALASLLLPPLGPDQAAQAFRAELFHRAGPAIWDNFWFAGHYLPGYSLLSPPLGDLLGPRPMAALAVVGSAGLFAAICEREWGGSAAAASIWFAAAASISLFTGRLTFALGVLVALAAVFAVQRGWRGVGLLLAAVVAAASPIAALFLVCGALAWWLAGRGPAGLEIAVAAMAGALALALLFPGGGTMPFAFSSFWPAFALTALAFLAVPREQAGLRLALVLYAAGLLAALLLPTPMGGNAVRLGALLLGPVVVIAGWSHRRALVVVLVPLILAWQVVPLVRDLDPAGADSAAGAAAYAGVLDYLRPRLDRNPGRVEVVPMADHWGAYRIGAELPMARGWERQSDRRLNPIFYEPGGPTASGYRRWLNRLSVAWVAVPAGDLDYAGTGEARLISRGLPYLTPAYRDRSWTVFRVRSPRPMVAPPARLTGLGVDWFSLRSPRAGTFTARIRFTPYWTVGSGRGCVGSGPGGLTRVELPAAGRIRVEARFSVAGALGRDRTCGG